MAAFALGVSGERFQHGQAQLAGAEDEHVGGHFDVFAGMELAVEGLGIGECELEARRDMLDNHLAVRRKALI